MYVFFFKQKTAYEMRISDWSSDVCSSDLYLLARAELLRLFVSEFQITSRGSIAVEIGCQSRKKVAEAPADRSNPGDMVARPRIVGMEIIHNCCVLQPVRSLHQQRSAIGTRVLVAEVTSRPEERRVGKEGVS